MNKSSTIGADLQTELGSPVTRILRTVAVSAVLILLISLVMFNAGRKPATIEKVWFKEMTIGNLEAKNHYVMYTDLMCPYCDIFARHLQKNQQEFKKDFLEKHDVLWEVRVTDFLREYGHDAPIYSEWSAEAVYCAKRENKFWEYYYAALDALDRDYHSKGVGISKTAPKISDMQPNYWLKSGEQINLSDNFKKCYQNHEALAEVRETTERASKLMGSMGLPSFQFNQKMMAGVDPTDDWRRIKLRLEQGLK